jgi:NO-binding membrane sensor protein with MHYT domain
MKLLTKKKCLVISAFVLTIIACYSALGMLQALSLFKGERLSVNLGLWGSIMVSSLVAGGICVYFAFRRKGDSKV